MIGLTFELYHSQILFTIELVRDSNETLFGFSVESELSNSSNDLRVYVMRVETYVISFSNDLFDYSLLSPVTQSLLLMVYADMMRSW